MHTLRKTLLVGALALVPGLVSAATLVSWGDSAAYITDATVAGQGLSGGAVSYSTTSPRSPSVGASYSGDSAVFYGGASTTGTSGGINLWSVSNNYANLGGNDAFTFRVSAAAVGAAGHALHVWNQADFLDLSTGNVAVTGFSVDARIAGSGITGEVRFVIVSDGTTLISAGQSFNAAATSTLALSDLSTASWFTYDPATSVSTVGSAFDTTGFAFDKVSSVGLLVKQERISGSTANMSAFWNAFSVSGAAVAAVPEPGAYGLLAGLAGLAWTMHRRRRVPSA